MPVKQITIESSDQPRPIFSSCSLSPNKNSAAVVKKIGGIVSGFKSSKPYQVIGDKGQRTQNLTPRSRLIPALNSKNILQADSSKQKYIPLNTRSIKSNNI